MKGGVSVMSGEYLGLPRSSFDPLAREELDGVALTHLKAILNALEECRNKDGESCCPYCDEPFHKLHTEECPYPAARAFLDSLEVDHE